MTTAGGVACCSVDVFVAVVVAFVEVSAGNAVVAVGIVRSGDVRGMSLDGSSSEPQAVSPPASERIASSASPRERSADGRKGAHHGDFAQATGSMRRPQCGQSLRSRCAS